MILAVFDCGALVSGIGWPGNPRRCLRLIAERQVRLCVTEAMWDEYDLRIPIELAEKRPGANPRPMLDWLLTVSFFVQPALLGKQRSRDLKDDRYLAGALAAQADALVTNDRDLLDLGKPFGVPMMTPIQFLHLVRGRAGM